MKKPNSRIYPYSGLRLVLMLIPALLLGGCGGLVYHTVKRGETLYSIGWAYGYDYHYIAEWNNIPPPYILKPGQRLRVAPPAGAPVVERVSRADNADQAGAQNPASSSTSPSRPPAKTSAANNSPAPVSGSAGASGSSSGIRNKVDELARQIFQEPVHEWRWPTRDKRILSTFLSSDPTRQGLDLAGERGNPVFAAATGRVVYAGSGLQRYGKLIILKHNETFLSAYAHNHRLHVKEGEVVKMGQKIADIGSTGTTRSKLYFEIRRNGKPVDPLRFLPR